MAYQRCVAFKQSNESQRQRIAELEAEAAPGGTMNDDYQVKNAIITDAVIDIADRGCLQIWLHLDYGGSGQGFGGYVLYLPKSWSHHVKHSGYAGHFLYRCMEIADVGQWGKICGKTIRVKANHGKVKAIGHIVKDDWFCPEDDFKEASWNP